MIILCRVVCVSSLSFLEELLLQTIGCRSWEVLADRPFGGESKFCPGNVLAGINLLVMVSRPFVIPMLLRKIVNI